MIKFFPLIILILQFDPLFAQVSSKVNHVSTDSTRMLDEVIVRAFNENRNSQSATTTVKIIDANNGDRNNKTSLVNGFNTIAGVRMEERSPGSYRINIRGSSLRSPFGVRNVKVYWNDMPVTDPGGNTYFNQFAWNNFSTIEIAKGPAGSLYGAGTGGLILMNTLQNWQPGIKTEYLTGSYNLQNFFFTAGFGKNENMNQLSYAHNQTDGYRIQSRMRRDNFSWVSKLKISRKQQFVASVLLTDMYYQTPGALTFNEFINNPKEARPAAGIFPSAVNAKAAVNQFNFLTGFNHIYEISPSFTNQVIFYGTISEFKNPTIRNYERRSEPSFGGRTVFTYEKKLNEIILKLLGGSEFQHGEFSTMVYGNINGNPDTLQTNDDITLRTNSYFLQGDLAYHQQWFIIAGISMNRTKVGFTRLSDYPVITQKRTYRNEIAPRISFKKMITNLSWIKSSVSRGFSPPTISELLPSTGIISTNLEAEYGWNFELTAGTELMKRKLKLEATSFYFRLNNALVQRRDSSGADYFVNAGSIKQNGLEFSADFKSFSGKGFISMYKINTALTLNNFHYGNFIKGSEDYSGKTVPSVPMNTFSLLVDLDFANNFYTNITYYISSKIFLNDANTAMAKPYHLLGWRGGWSHTFSEKFKMNIYLGADNLFDEIYSLGNDINAVANRFYNAAPRRNYYLGISIQWLHTSSQ
jgi:iron complex outermembrane receptor protein